MVKLGYARPSWHPDHLGNSFLNLESTIQRAFNALRVPTAFYPGTKKGYISVTLCFVWWSLAGSNR
jgi:hypothetical protein